MPEPAVRHLEADVLIVGAGPAGMAAAIAATRSGRRVTVLDAAPAPGGALWRSAPANRPTAARPWFARWEAAAPRFLPATTIVAAPAERTLLAESPDGPLTIAWQRLILATGARELFLPFPGWTLPGVTGPGGLQLLVKSGWPVANRRVVVAGSGPLLLAAAAYLRQHQARVVTIAEQAPWSRLLPFALQLPTLAPGKLLQAASYQAALLGIPYRASCWPVEAHGRDRVEAVTLTDGRRTWRLPCDDLACAFGLVPNTELVQLLGCPVTDGCVRVDASQRTAVPDVFAAGEPTGVGGVDKALVEGEIAGFVAAGNPAGAERLQTARARAHRFLAAMETAFALRPELKALARPETKVCRCEDVTRRQMEPCADWRAAKLHTRCGMGSCQGRVCGAAARVLFGWEPSSVRPPVFPTAIATLLAAPPASGAFAAASPATNSPASRS